MANHIIRKKYKQPIRTIHSEFAIMIDAANVQVTAKIVKVIYFFLMGRKYSLELRISMLIIGSITWKLLDLVLNLKPLNILVKF
jgi:hypothetical protein